MKMNDIIKRRRKELELTQEQVAEYLGVTAPAVHKWEKGTSCPDVMILPALARLLQVDMNELFSFGIDLSDQEVDFFLEGVQKVMQQDGFVAGFQMIAEKVREYPTCARLLYMGAFILDGGRILYGWDQKEAYEKEIEELYERAVRYGNQKIQDQAKNMLIIRYLKQERFEEAEMLWETLPEITIDKQRLKATICMQKGETEEGLDILKKELLKSTSKVQNILQMMMNRYQRLHQEEEARLCARQLKETIDTFGYWEYGKHAVDFQMGIYQKDKEKTLSALRNMLESMNKPHGADAKSMEDMRKALVQAFQREQKSGLDGEGFLAEDESLCALLKKYE